MAEEKRNGIWRGILLVLLIILVAGFFIVRKNKKFSGEHEYYVYYPNVKGLQSSSPVLLKGVRVGKISDIDLNGGGKVRVSLRIKKGIEIPKGTIALLASGNVLGDKLIRLVPGNGPGTVADFSVLPGTDDTSVMKVAVQIAPYLETGKLLLKSTDTSLKNFNLLLQTHLLTKIVHGFVGAEKTFNTFSAKTAGWNESAANVASKIAHFDSTTTSMAANSQNLETSLNKLQTKTGNINNKPLKQNMEELQASVNKLKVSFARYNKSDSGLGRLINNKQAYNNISNNFDTLNQNMQSTYHHPTGFSIFGGKKKKK